MSGANKHFLLFL